MYGKAQEYPQPPPEGYNQPFPEQPSNPAYQQVPQAAAEPNNQQYDPYGAADGLSRKLSADTRIGFIRKVLGILSVQLIFTAVGCSMVLNDQYGAKMFFDRNPGLAILAAVGYLVTLYALGCYRSVARAVPTNYILLSIFTLCMTYIVANIVVYYDVYTVVSAAIITAAMVSGLTFYAMTTKTDFTYCGGIMWALFMVMASGIVMGLIFRDRISQIFLSCVVIFIVSFYIIYDVQLICGQRANKIDIDDYIFAAMMLYVDIVRIFIEILRIIGKK